MYAVEYEVAAVAYLHSKTVPIDPMLLQEFANSAEVTLTLIEESILQSTQHAQSQMATRYNQYF